MKHYYKLRQEDERYTPFLIVEDSLAEQVFLYYKGASRPLVLHSTDGWYKDAMSAIKAGRYEEISKADAAALLL